MKIVIVNGSPRSEGNTGTLLRSFAKKAKERGAEVTYFEIVDKNVQDCDGCYRCDTQDRCAKDDDMTDAYDLIQGSDVLVLGSPIYMGMETGMTKCFVDRLYYLMAKKRLAPGKKAVALFTCGLVDGHVIYGYMHQRFDKIFRHDLGFLEARTMMVPGTGNRTEIQGNFYAQSALAEIEQFIFPDE